MSDPCYHPQHAKPLLQDFVQITNDFPWPYRPIVWISLLFFYGITSVAGWCFR